MFFRNGTCWARRISLSSAFGLTGRAAMCMVFALVVAFTFVAQHSVMAQSVNVQAIARQYPKFTSAQQMAILQAEQASRHPDLSQLSLMQLYSRFMKFIARPVPHDASTTPPLANFSGNLTQITLPAPESLYLMRQSDCSLTLNSFTVNYQYGSSPTVSDQEVTKHYEQTLHSEAGLSTTGGAFAKGCASPTLGISTRRGMYLGQTTSGLYLIAGADYYPLSQTNALYYGTGSTSSNSVSTFVTDTSEPNIVALTAGDLNGDGVADVVAIDQLTTSASVSVRLAHADGTISSATSYPVVGTKSEAATVDDVNGDGKPDVVVASIDSSGQEHISVLTGKGDGTLDSAVSINVSSPTSSSSSSTKYTIANLITADLRNSGHKDIVTSTGEVLLNNGTGSFTVAPTTAFAARTASSQYGPNLAAGDLNNDGIPDLVLNDGGQVSTYLGKGDGTFTAGAVYVAPDDVGYVTITDLDGDGNNDVYVGIANGGFFTGDQFSTQFSYALMGNGDGTLRGAPSLPFMFTGSNIADLNNDGVLDAVGVTANASTGVFGFTSYLGNKNGSFTQKSTVQIFPVTVNNQTCSSGSVDSYALGDFNGDGFADIVYLIPDCTNGLFLATGKGDGTFNEPVAIPSTTPDYTSINTVQIADFNHDGKPDVLYYYSTNNGSSQNNGFAVQLGNGNGTLQAPLLVQTSSTPSSSSATPALYVVAVGDVSSDGYPDVFTVSTPVCNSSPCAPGTFQLYLGKGDGTFKSPATMPINPGLTGGLLDPYSQVVLADMNGDGHQDVVALAPISAGGLAIYLGKGDGTFATPSFINVGGSGAAVADFNGDGKLDVAVLRGGYSGTYFSGIYLGNGDGTLQSIPDSNGYPQPSESLLFNDFFDKAFTADFNHDGTPDILFGNSLLLSQTGSSSSSTLAATATGLTASSSSVSAGTSIKFTATVAETAGKSTPTGTVTFSDGTTTLGTAVLASGVASFSTASLSVGTHSITAAYGGDTANATSSSATVVVTITAPVPADFGVALSSTSASVSPGSSATSTITVTPTGGFNQAVTFTCSGLPANSSCSFSPASVTPNGTSAATSTLTIATDVNTASLTTKPLHKTDGTTSLAMLASGWGLGLLLLRRRRKSRGLWRLQMGLAAAFLFTSMAIGCGGGSSDTTGKTTTPTTPAGTSDITVTATAGSAIHTAKYSLTVQ